MDGLGVRIALVVACVGLGVLYLVRAPAMAAAPRARLGVRAFRRLGVLWMTLALLQLAVLAADR